MNPEMIEVQFASGQSIPWAVTELKIPPVVFPAPEVPPEEGMRTFYYEGLPLQGKPTRIFAIYAVPSHASPEKKVPGIVLVHGGSGTAFSDWARLWRDRGYATIAMDHDGGIPIGGNGKWQAAPQGGPRFQEVEQVNQAVDEQWMYHAVADVILANSLLRSFPEVDAERIGIAGISWGGVITSITIGVDPRFKFACSVYGCGFISEEAQDGSCFVGKDATPEIRERWSNLWDPANYLPRFRVPMLWVNGTNDPAFTLASLRKSVLTSPGPHTLSIHLRMPHGHGGPGESPKEIHAFAKSIVGAGEPLVRITHMGKQPDGVVWIVYDAPASIPVREAQLFTTKDSCCWQDRYWNASPAIIDPVRQRVSARLPTETVSYFLNIIDDLGIVVSSVVETLAANA